MAPEGLNYVHLTHFLECQSYTFSRRLGWFTVLFFQRRRRHESDRLCFRSPRPRVEVQSRWPRLRVSVALHRAWDFTEAVQLGVPKRRRHWLQHEEFNGCEQLSVLPANAARGSKRIQFDLVCRDVHQALEWSGWRAFVGCLAVCKCPGFHLYVL